MPTRTQTSTYHATSERKRAHSEARHAESKFGTQKAHPRNDMAQYPRWQGLQQALGLFKVLQMAADKYNGNRPHAT